MLNVAIFAGSFDPFTRGHENIVNRALPLFDKIVVAVGKNPSKKCFFSIEQRMDFIQKTFENSPKIVVEAYDSLTVNFAQKHQANFLLRGLRNTADFETERNLAAINKSLSPNIETIFIYTELEFSHISSSIVREILCHGGDASDFLPSAVKINL